MKRLAKLLLTLAPLLVTPLHAAARPNILFIFCDDLTNQALSCLGDSRELLENSNIDRLASQGMKFTRCLVPNSICGPSRATVLTGKYSHLNGFYSNVGGRPFDGAQQTFPKLLQKPFLLMSQHKAPHREWAPALRHLGLDNDRVYPEPETLFDAYDGKRGLAWRDQEMTLEKSFTDHDAKLVAPPSLTQKQRKQWDAYYEPRHAKFRAANLSGKELVRWRYQRYMHDYLATIKAVDESVGRLLDFLDAEGLAKNTVVVFSSDQGFFLGEHGWFDKRWIVEESLRTPLIVRAPGLTQPGSASNRIVSVVDFAQTFLDLAGAPPPADMQGRSLVPLLRGATPADWRKSFYYHYYEYPQWHKVRPHYGVVTDRYKLVHYYKPDLDEWELYDLQANPAETRNFIADPAYAETAADLRIELARLRTELKLPPLDQEPRHAYGKAPFDAPGQPQGAGNGQ